MSPAQYRRPGKLWYVSDGFIWDDHPRQYGRDGHQLECSSKLFIYNPQKKTARVTARFHHVDRKPTETTFSVRAGAIDCLELASLNEVPHRQGFWIAVESSVPVLPQARHEDYTFWDPVPDGINAVAPYPGPLRDEKSWVFPDCFRGGSIGWYELETLSILNPSKKDLFVKVRYLHRASASVAEEEIAIPAEQVAWIEPWERLPRLTEPSGHPPLAISSEYAVRLDASAPIVAQSTRRARWKGFAPIIGERSTMGVPVSSDAPGTWYYPGGCVVDKGNLPRATPEQGALGQSDKTWNLLFVHNLNGRKPNRANVTFHHPDGSTTTPSPMALRAGCSERLDLHGDEWRGEHLELNQPFGLTVSGKTRVVPGITCAEFEIWSQVCPGAMTAVNFYPAPLRSERRWWLGIAESGGEDTRNVEWEQSYHLMNPGKRSVDVTFSFLGAGRVITYSVSIEPEGVVRVLSTDIPRLPLHRPFAVRADGDRPFVAQVFVRARTRGHSQTRSIYSTLGTPMPLK
jgi:hypothetical protein